MLIYGTRSIYFVCSSKPFHLSPSVWPILVSWVLYCIITWGTHEKKKKMNVYKINLHFFIFFLSFRLSMSVIFDFGFGRKTSVSWPFSRWICLLFEILSFTGWGRFVVSLLPPEWKKVCLFPNYPSNLKVGDSRYCSVVMGR